VPSETMFTHPASLSGVFVGGVDGRLKVMPLYKSVCSKDV
jgi:hypothetical protein